MPRQLKHDPESNFYHFDNVNPNGNRAGDCVVRAIAKATGKTWDEVYDDLYVIGRKIKRMPNDKETYDRYLKQLGWKKMKAPKKSDNTRYTGREFVKICKNCIMHIGGHHLSCIINGKVTDIWDCSRGSVGNYWVKE